jgi:methionyl-tRNA formyltransferase
MRILFMGSSEFACPALDALLARGADAVAGVVTQPDRPRGRNLELAACPVRQRLAGTGVPVLTPERVNEAGSVAAMRALNPDLLVVVAYGQILRRDLLTLAPGGCVNVHASLLPQFRGAAPIQWALASGARVTGVTTMFMNEGLDAGDIILQREVPIAETDTGGTLHDRLARAGAELLLDTLDAIRRGAAGRVPQDAARVSFAPKLKKSDGRIDWGMSAEWIACRVRAFTPWPGCTAEIPAGSGRMVRILAARIEPGAGRAGTVLEAGADGPLVQTGRGALRLLDVQPEGRKAMSGAAFLRGKALRAGEWLG